MGVKVGPVPTTVPSEVCQVNATLVGAGVTPVASYDAVKLVPRWPVPETVGTAVTFANRPAAPVPVTR